MWFERYVIIVSSLSNDYIPWAWGQLNPTWADWGILAGSFGWFGMWFLLFAKNFPIVAIQEIKEMIPMPRKRGRAPLMALLEARRRVPGRARLVRPRGRRGGRHPRAPGPRAPGSRRSTPPRPTTRSRRRWTTG